MSHLSCQACTRRYALGVLCYVPGVRSVLTQSRKVLTAAQWAVIFTSCDKRDKLTRFNIHVTGKIIKKINKM